MPLKDAVHVTDWHVALDSNALVFVIKTDSYTAKEKGRGASGLHVHDARQSIHPQEEAFEAVGGISDGAARRGVARQKWPLWRWQPKKVWQRSFSRIV